MKPITQLFKTDAALEAQGTWIEYGEYGKFLIARSGGANGAFRRKFDQLMRPHQAAHNLGALDSQTEREITARAFSETIVKDWELVNDAGEAVPYSTEACYKLLLDLPNLLDDLLRESQRIANFNAILRDETGKV